MITPLTNIISLISNIRMHINSIRTTVTLLLPLRWKEKSVPVSPHTIVWSAMSRHTAFSPSRAGTGLQYAALAERLVMMNAANTTHVSTENTYRP